MKKSIIIFIVIVVLLVVACLLVTREIAYPACREAGDRLGYASRWDLWSGCRWFVNGRWLPVGEIR